MTQSDSVPPMIPAAGAVCFSMFGRLRACFIHPQWPTTQYRPIEGLQSLFRVFFVGHFDEGEPARLSGVTIEHDAH